MVARDSSYPGDGVSEVVLLSHQRGKKTNKTKQNIPSSNAMQFQLVLQHAILDQSSHQRKRKKKKGLETVL
jgi:hypothetical protein